jgi:hypothetical protein
LCWPALAPVCRFAHDGVSISSEALRDQVSTKHVIRGQWRWPLLTVAGLAISAVAFVGTSTAATPREVTLAPSNSDAHVSSAVTLPSTRRSAPVKLVIRAIGVSTSVGKLGLQPDGEVMVPTTIHTVGWYIDGPSPGQEGSAVILGHVDSYKGVGVFFNLKSLKAGDLISVTSSDGVATRFSVTRVVCLTTPRATTSPILWYLADWSVSCRPRFRSPRNSGRCLAVPEHDGVGLFKPIIYGSLIRIPSTVLDFLLVSY